MRLRGALILFLLTILFTSAALAQEGASQLRGRVSAADGSALPGVTVTIKHQESGVVRTTVTDKDGVYVMSAVTPGTYELTAELLGFHTFRRRNVRLEVGKTSTVDVKLDLGAMAEEMTVTAAAPIIDVTSKEVGGNITTKELTELPSVNRNFVGFIALLPGVVPNISTESFGADSVSVNGQDPRNNNYLFDGGNNNDDVIGQRAGSQARVALDAIQEFQVLTGQYDAEFGRTTGAVVNAITKQGTNELKGMVSGYFQGPSLTQKDYFVRQSGGPKPGTKSRQYATNLGGPIIHDRLHFFANVERVEIDRANSAFIAARPEINEPTTQDRVWNTLGRLDFQLNPSATFAARYLRESSPQLNQIIPLANGNPVTPAASRQESDVDQTAVGESDLVISNSKVNTARLTWTQENVAFGNPGFNSNGRRQDLLPPTLDFLTYEDQQSSVAQARVDDAWNLNDTFNWYVKNHDMKFGVEYERVKENSTDQGNMNGTFTFRTNDFDPNDPRTYPERLSIRVPGANALLLKATYMSAFAQDKWNINNATTLSMGLRYDLEKLPFTERDNPLFANGEKYPYDKNNFSPRIGVTYQLPTARTTVLRGGVGRFYDKTHLELIQAVETAGMFSNSFTVNFPANAADPGPSNGVKPTDPMLVNGPVVNFNLLKQLYPPGTRIKNTGTINLDNPDRTVPYTDQISVGVQREIHPNMSVNVDYIHANGRDQLMLLDQNPGTRADTKRTTPVKRTNPLFPSSSAALERVNTGRTTYNAVEFQLDHHLGQAYQYRISYTYSKSRGNTSGNGAPQILFQKLDAMNLDRNEGPTDFDKPHNFVFSGSWAVPRTGGLILSSLIRYLSGDPLTIQDSNFDLDQNGVLFDPLPAGKYSGSGANSITVVNKGGRNGARGPDFFQMDMRIGYKIAAARGTAVELFGDIFNVTNRANFANPSGDRRSSAFLVLTTLRSGAIPRTAQIGARLSF